MKLSSPLALPTVVAIQLAAASVAFSQPVFTEQPASQTVVAGSAATLKGLALVPGAIPPLPSVTSGSLRLWLKADAGVVSSGGQVSAWRDQSGKGFDALQTNGAFQPSFVSSDSPSGEPAVRFDGVQNGSGAYLANTSDIGIPDAMTIFTVYNPVAVNYFDGANLIWFAGTPGDFGGCRGPSFLYGNLNFTTWGYDYETPYAGPMGAFRISADRVTTNLTAVDICDETATSSNSFNFSMSSAHAPSPGYFVGGTDFVNPDNFEGDIAEVICYSGYLSDADRAAVLGYLQQKYYYGGSLNAVSYQWQFDSTNIANATNDTLTLANVQGTNAGTYTLVATDSDGSANSSNAVLTVVYPPSITTQPASQEVSAGSNASFSVVAAGSGVLSYQWLYNGSPLAGQTNTSLSLSNCQSSAAGDYSVRVSSSYGSVTSANAVLAIDLLPVIVSQPQSQNAAIGGSVTFSVSGGGYLPQVASGSLDLWLKADAGVQTTPSNTVSAWLDQSGNANDAAQTSGIHQPALVPSAPFGGKLAVRFNGSQNGINGSYLHGTNDLGLANSFTAFTVYSAAAVNYEDNANIMWLAGEPGYYGESRGCTFLYGNLNFTTWAYDYETPYAGPLNAVQITTDCVNSNASQVRIFDQTATNATNFTYSMSGALPPSPGYFVGGLDFSAPDSFDGDLAEILIYHGVLTDADRAAVQTYLEQKYYGNINGLGLMYQWQFDGTNIAGATNASLTLTNVQPAQAGAYTVVVTDLAGSVTSSNAVLTTGYAPAFSTQPQSQAVINGQSVAFSAVASGDSPISYQWTFNGGIIPAATNASFTLPAATTNDDGVYAVTATNPFGSATSSNADLTVNLSTLQAVSASVAGGRSVTVPIQLLSLGVENAVQFSLDFDPAMLSYSGAALGASAQGDLLYVNTNELAAGKVGVTVLSPGGAFAAGTNDLVDFTFQGAVLTAAANTQISFGNDPTVEQISDPQADSILAVFVPANVAISGSQLEGDVAPLPNGDGAVSVIDWAQEERFVAGLDTITNAAEFQRADCAPRDTGGDGSITVADLVQLGRYAAGLDPLTAVGEFTTNGPAYVPRRSSDPRTFFLTPEGPVGPISSALVQISALGGENALQFSLSFDPAAVRFAGASLAAGAPGGVLVVNTSQSAAGSVGFVLAMPPGTAALSAGSLSLLRVNFASVSYSNNAALRFTDAPILRQLVDTHANLLPASYQNGQIAVTGSPWPQMAIGQSGKNATLTWPLSTASKFVLESATSLNGPWTPVSATITTNGNALNFSTPISGAQTFYRLQGQ